VTRRHVGRAFAAGGGLLAVLIAGAIAVERSREPPPAPPEALARVAQKNEDAAMAAAARMKAESEAAAEAVDARITADEDAGGAAPATSR
jgi:hypothetical protein